MKALRETVKAYRYQEWLLFSSPLQLPGRDNGKDHLKVPLSNTEESSCVILKEWCFKRPGERGFNHSLLVWPRFIVCVLLLLMGEGVDSCTEASLQSERVNCGCFFAQVQWPASSQVCTFLAPADFLKTPCIFSLLGSYQEIKSRGVRLLLTVLTSLLKRKFQSSTSLPQMLIKDAVKLAEALKRETSPGIPSAPNPTLHVLGGRRQLGSEESGAPETETSAACTNAPG